MWYNTIPSFVPMDLHTYCTYYYGIKGFDTLISRRKEIHASNIVKGVITYFKIVS